MATELNVSELDFDLIQNNIRLFLENQTELLDYNFNGAVMSIMVELLAYVTHYNAIYGNQILNETFLDTALLRSSVVSRAKELGYIPRQYTSAFTPVTITVNVPGGDTRTTFEIPKGTNFTGEKDGKSINFVVTQQFVLDNKVGDSFVGDIILREGTYVEDSFIFDSTEENPLFVVTPEQIDTEFTEVEVSPFEGSASKEVYVESTSIVELDANSKVYFWQENKDGDVEFYFGDGIVGEQLTNGNEIIISTLKTLGSQGNEVNSYVVAENIADINRSNITVVANDYSKSGTDRENLESIRTLSPRLFSVQDRLVTLNDYIAYVSKNFGNIQSLSAWDGSDNIPPFFGRVFLSIKPTDSDQLSTFEKTQILESILTRSVAGVSVEIVDPELTFVNINTEVVYDKNLTNFLPEQLETVIDQAITDYFDENTNDLGNDLVYSRLVAAIDDSNTAIVGNLTDVSLTKKFIPNNFASTYLFDFGNVLEPGTLVSNTWTDSLNNFNLQENSSGTVDLYRDGTLLTASVATVNHASGLVEFQNFNPSINTNDQIILTVVPAKFDVEALRNNILIRDNVTISIIEK